MATSYAGDVSGTGQMEWMADDLDSLREMVAEEHVIDSGCRICGQTRFAVLELGQADGSTKLHLVCLGWDRDGACWCGEQTLIVTHDQDLVVRNDERNS